MFPSIQLAVTGLERRARYCVLLEVEPASDRRHKYVGGGVEKSCGNRRGWTSAGPAEPQPLIDRRIYLHPDSPATGAHWMQHPLNFNKLKLTNNAVDPRDNVSILFLYRLLMGKGEWIFTCKPWTKSFQRRFNPKENVWRPLHLRDSQFPAEIKLKICGIATTCSKKTFFL